MMCRLRMPFPLTDCPARENISCGDMRLRLHALADPCTFCSQDLMAVLTTAVCKCANVVEGRCAPHHQQSVEKHRHKTQEGHNLMAQLLVNPPPDFSW